jgi:hypothetical protein
VLLDAVLVAVLDDVSSVGAVVLATSGGVIVPRATRCDSAHPGRASTPQMAMKMQVRRATANLPSGGWTLGPCIRRW